jgi:hypothetical protein
MVKLLWDCPRYASETTCMHVSLKGVNKQAYGRGDAIASTFSREIEIYTSCCDMFRNFLSYWNTCMGCMFIHIRVGAGNMYAMHVYTYSCRCWKHVCDAWLYIFVSVCVPACVCVPVCVCVCVCVCVFGFVYFA